MSIQFARSAETPALIDRPARRDGPTQVSVGIWIVDITNIDSAQQNFTADIAVVLRWKDARLAHTGTEWRTTHSTNLDIREWLSRMKRIRSFASSRTLSRSSPMAP